MIEKLGANPAKLSQSLSSDQVRAVLRDRAEFLRAIREYFYAQGVTEVETPLLYEYAVSDPHIENLTLASTTFFSSPRYLQSSPESSLKQLLAKGSGSIYQLGKVFRDDPLGAWHSQEFTMLEWYRVGFSLCELQRDVVGLLQALNFEVEGYLVSSYQQVFERYCKLDPLSASVEIIRERALQLIDVEPSEAERDDRDYWLDLLMGHVVQPNLGKDQFEFVCDYPASQAALAEVEANDNGKSVARRFELFYRGVELANAYQELCCPEELETTL